MVGVLVGWGQYFFFVYGKVRTAFEVELGRVFDIDHEPLAYLWVVCASEVYDRCFVCDDFCSDFFGGYSLDHCES